MGAAAKSHAESGLNQTRGLARTLRKDLISVGGETAGLDFVDSSLGQLCGKQI